MKTIFLVLAFLAITNADFCYNEVVSTCNVGGGEGELKECNSKYSAAQQVMKELNDYVQHHVGHSFQYLLMASHFNNYEKNREGFSKLYRKLSDQTWEDTIDLIKYITKRGGKVDFDTPRYTEANPAFKNVFEMYELESLSRALDMHKSLAEKAHEIHSEVTKRKVNYHDAETISYIEKQFVHQHSEIIRELAGHTNDLTKLIKGSSDSTLSTFLFDQHLNSIL